MNTIPTLVGVQCLLQVSTGHCGYSWVSTELSILIIYYTKLIYIHNKNTPLSHLEQGRGLSSLRTEQKKTPAHVCSRRGGGVPSCHPHPHCTLFPPHEQLLMVAVGGAVLVVVLRCHQHCMSTRMKHKAPLLALGAREGVVAVVGKG